MHATENDKLQSLFGKFSLSSVLFIENNIKNYFSETTLNTHNFDNTNEYSSSAHSFKSYFHAVVGDQL